MDLGDDQWAGLLDPAYYDQAGQEPQAGNGDDQWAGLLDPAYYDQAGMLGTDDDLQEFLKGNEEFLKFGQDAMEE